MKKHYYKGHYNTTASIGIGRKGYELRVCDGNGQLFHHKRYDSFRGARTALGKLGDGWREV